MRKSYFPVMKGSVVLLALLAVFSFFDHSRAAPDFDFYSADLIAHESYRRISMDFKDASLKNILKVFSEQAGLNFIAAQSVQDRTVTLYLDNVPLQEALNKIMTANNLKYELDPGSNIFIVKELGRPDIDVITKIYNLKYARLKDSTLDKAIKSGSAGTEGLSGGGTAAASAGGAPSASSAGGAIEDTVAGVLTKHGKLMIDYRTNSLIVTDIPTHFEIIDRVIALLDVSTPQVMIEVEMLDVSKKTIDQMGVSTSRSLMSLTGSSVPTKFPNFMWDGQTGTPEIPDGGFQFGTLSAALFRATLDLLTSDARTKFLARPRILTLSNEAAQIKIVTNEAIGLKTTTQSSEGAATQTAEAERFETGVRLDVTPQVDVNTDSVTMFIQPVVSQTVASAISSGTTTFRDPEIRSSATTLVVKNGETIVVGGLIRKNDVTVVTKIPFFGDIPILGALFRHKSKDDEERELIVFITPHILGRQEAVALAREGISSPMPAPHREQSFAISRQQKVDSMLERWEK